MKEEQQRAKETQRQELIEQTESEIALYQEDFTITAQNRTGDALKANYLDPVFGPIMDEDISTLDELSLKLHGLKHPELYISPEKMRLVGTAMPREGQWMKTTPILKKFHARTLRPLHEWEPSSEPIDPKVILLPKWRINWESGQLEQKPADLNDPKSEVAVWQKNW